MKKMSMMLALLLYSVFGSGSAHAQQGFRVVIDYPGLNVETATLNYPQPVRLNTLLLDAIAPLNGEQLAQINWSKARLGSDKLNDQFSRKRAQLDDRLNALELFWQQRGYHEYRQGINFIRRQLNEKRYLASFYMGIDFDLTRVVLSKNPFLTTVDGNTFYLRLPTGAVASIDAGIDAKAGAASVSMTYAIAVNGDIAEIPSGLHNSNQSPQCYTHTVTSPLDNKLVGDCAAAVTLESIHLLHSNALPQGYEDLNLQIAEILKFAIGDAQ